MTAIGTDTGTATITIQLPHDVMERRLLVAEQQCQPLEGIVAKIVSDSVESLPLSIETSRNSNLSNIAIAAQALQQREQAKERLTRQTKEELQASAQLELASADKERALELLSLNSERELMPDEQRDLETLYAKTEEVATTRVAALWLLKQNEKVAE